MISNHLKLIRHIIIVLLYTLLTTLQLITELYLVLGYKVRQVTYQYNGFPFFVTLKINYENFYFLMKH